MLGSGKNCLQSNMRALDMSVSKGTALAARWLPSADFLARAERKELVHRSGDSVYVETINSRG